MWKLLLLFIFLSTPIFAQQGKKNDFLRAKKDYQNFEKEHSNLIKTKNTELHYLRWGNPKYQTIIWLPGSYSNAFEIEPFVKKISKLKYNIIAIDYYGHGQTKPPKNNYSTKELLDDIHALLDSLKISSCIIGGFSRGASLATMFYEKYPHRVSALILEDGGISPFLEHFKILPNEVLKIKFEEELKNRPKELFEEYETEEDAYYAILPFGENKKENLYKNLSFIKHENKKYFIYKDLDKIYGMDSYDNISNLLQGKLYSNPFANDLMVFPFFEVIKVTKVPTLLLEASSKEDPFKNSTYYERLKQTKNIQHKLFKKSNHTIHYEQPKEFMKALTEFLKSNTFKQ